PARTAVTEGVEAPAPQEFTAVLDSPLYSLEVFVEPAQVGSNRIHLYAYERGTREPLRVEEWSATASLPAAGVERLEVTLVGLTDTPAFGEASLPIAGDWELRFSLRTSEIDQAAVTATVPVR